MDLAVIVALLSVLGGGSVLLAVEGLGRLRRLYEQGGEQHWARLGAAVGLLHGHGDQGEHILEGQREGVWLNVTADGVWMVVRGRIDAPMPAGLEIRRRRRLSARHRLHTGNPLLDSTLDIAGSQPAAALLQDPELVAPIMGVVHAWPDAAIDERYVVLRYPDALGRELDGRCQEVIDAVLALRAASRRLL
ncbi:MAG: hypothetical protein ACI8S6_001240 [Myxococcota bacterium]|jgi:hypothetical protein